MKADPTYLLKSLSNNDVTFFIPPYQRNYEWSTATCKVFLTDIQRTAEQNRQGRYAEHFFGSVVYVVEQSGFGVPDKFVLTDGQQRITTSMLFLIALRDTVEDPEYKEQIQKSYLQNERADETTPFKIKLKQVETDWEAYRLLALGLDVPRDLTNSIVYQNYQFFRKELMAIPEGERKSLLELGLAKFSTIAIQLEPNRNHWENPQEIFESMNSLGKPLSLADLVRNFLLMGKSSAEQDKLYNDFWLSLETRLRGILSEFIRDWMQADRHASFKVAGENNYKELYSNFKDIVLGRRLEDLFADFVRFSSAYSIARGLEKSGSKEIDQVLSDFQVIGVGPGLSFIAEIVAAWQEGKAPSQNVVRILKSIRTFLLRRRILGMAVYENKMFPVLGANLAEIFVAEDPEEKIFSFLANQIYAGRLPNDDELRSRLEGLNFYNLGRSRNYPRLLLSLAEETLTKSRPAWDDPMLQLEHIMPQTLNSDWLAELGVSAEDDHQALVNNLGNITLIRHNQELGNKSFAEKKATYRGKSGLQVSMNSIVDVDVWNREAITSRRDYIIELFLTDVLSVPASFRQSSNWKQDSGDESKFDVREILNKLIGETIHYAPDPRIRAVVQSDSKVLFEGQEWSVSSLTRELKQREGDVSKKSNFSGAVYWCWEDTRLADLEL